MNNTVFDMLPHDMRRFLYSKVRKPNFDSLQNMRLVDAIGKTNTYKPFDEYQCILCEYQSPQVCRSRRRYLAI